MTKFHNLRAMQQHILKIHTKAYLEDRVLITTKYSFPKSNYQILIPKYQLQNTDQSLFCRPRRASVDKESYLKYVSKRRVGGGVEIEGARSLEGEEEGEGRTAVDCTSVLRSVLRKGSFRLVVITL